MNLTTDEAAKIINDIAAATFDEACRRAGQIAANKNPPPPSVIVARPTAVYRTPHITTTDPAAIAEWFTD